MSHKEIYKWFELYFPNYAGNKVEAWFPHGKNAIRVRQMNRQEFIFTYNGQQGWRFETIKSFFKNSKGGKQ